MAASENVIPVTDSTFEAEVLMSECPVLVDFWAPRCGPCMSLGPVIDQLAEEYRGRVKVVKVNADENVETAARYGVRGIPTFLFFKGGEAVGQIVGAGPKTRFTGEIEGLVAPGPAAG